MRRDDSEPIVEPSAGSRGSHVVSLKKTGEERTLIGILHKRETGPLIKMSLRRNDMRKNHNDDVYVDAQSSMASDLIPRMLTGFILHTTITWKEKKRYSALSMMQHDIHT